MNIPDRRRPSDPTEAHAWAHIPAAALNEAIEASEADAKAAWEKCATAVNQARDEFNVIYAWFRNVGAVSTTLADAGYLEREAMHRICEPEYRLDPDISKPLVRMGVERGLECHFGT
ncbi:MAG: hypothetical protein CL927_15325 [Deltaproteobacteria bacterium]|nr:hypothetical protein [Deltaproteobacteria bacterium]HCH64525.1 hypothetical protein [Deltaproteobacteria bacterium]